VTASCAFLFPGQGSQSVGMGKDLFGSHASVKRLFDEASEVLGKNLAKLCFEGPEAELVRTDNVQPAITLVNLACLQVLREQGIVPSAAAGHSLGEYAALCAAGVFTFADTLRLVQARGAAMQEAAERHPGGMTAIFGLDKHALAAICEEAASAGAVEVANHNSPAQVVLTGTQEGLQQAVELAKKRGAKLCVPLKVSGPWHSCFMRDAQERLRQMLAQCAVARPSFPVISNVTAEAHAGPESIRELLVAQLVSPVLWLGSMQRLLRDGYAVCVEAGPGKALAGLMRDITRDAKVFSALQPDDLSKLRTMVA
jgi:[acyl-carrier-protein] S-malonyltransferase